MEMVVSVEYGDGNVFSHTSCVERYFETSGQKNPPEQHVET